MKLSPEESKPAITRLKRAKGQLEAVIRMLENGEECESTVMQLAAVSKAIDRAAYLVVARGMQQCFMEGGEQFDQDRLEKLFLSLA
ncbi:MULTISPECIES: metal-sensitive transcriptional regulator [Corynebacterium]|uniref:Transcriptional regulator n=2 Tax=Corynebacterium TaxID=1716 RepID=A0A6I8MH13_9CORY|nr:MULTISPECIES: metal-sensitive transcriptional regulator [Corynebacterium]OLN15288.1 cytoplasmic protein [Corynebacterium diphtheriae] [Corynebacterium diphtheriae subsp. lausannense]QVI98646.1 metal-sensitive transcriptional regulator [Corynebacterium diphtheriae]MBG9244120.1 metal-sensitive transcriptional regulator [Corynebacterium belfantii]MBG9259449.1 metal-sensitive transcriptional regulator [Corynebacterium belfantii]MBG9266196.1 metal-sensitive transcriptional regulator [Corynebacte